METTVVNGTWLGVDWGAVEAIATGLTAVLTLALLLVAGYELNELRKQFAQSETDRALEIAELRRQSDAAEGARKAAARPVVVVMGGIAPDPLGRTWEVPFETPEGSDHFFMIRNVGLGPAIEVSVNLWPCAMTEGSVTWSGNDAPSSALADFIAELSVLAASDCRHPDSWSEGYMRDEGLAYTDPQGLDFFSGFAWLTTCKDAYGDVIEHHGFLMA